MEHPNKKYITNATKEQLTNRLRYVKMAINSWQQNVYNTSKAKAEKELQFFKDEKRLIDKELKNAL